MESCEGGRSLTRSHKYDCLLPMLPSRPCLFGLVMVFYIITFVILFANILTFFLPKPCRVRQVD